MRCACRSDWVCPLSSRNSVYACVRALSSKCSANAATPTQGRASAVDGRLDEARLALKEDDVRGAQRLLDGVKADLAAPMRAA